MRFFALLLPLLLISSPQACINDRDSDSLASQAKKLPNTLRVITGRFERNPPLYYQMRIQRSLEELKKNPRQYGLYDDIGAAYDRLHRDNDALRIMESKRALLPPYNAKNGGVKEAWYRYYANAGTFRAHRWLSAGAKSQSLSEMKKARDFIGRAMQIEPNAHFGREKYQLITMEWIIATRQRKGVNVGTLADWMRERDNWGLEDGAPIQNRAATEGLAGLVVLGAAWQSPDIFEALAVSLENKDGIALRYLAMLRCRELLRSGKASFNPATLSATILGDRIRDPWYSESTGIAVNKTNQKTLDKLFPQLRTEAETWAGHRTAYMLAKLEEGKHPDTDPKFWNDWNPSAPPSVDVNWFDQGKNEFVSGPGATSSSSDKQLLGLIGIVALTSVGVVATSLIGLRFLSRRHRRTAL